jgi:predicted alpha/beta hydrolase
MAAGEIVRRTTATSRDISQKNRVGVLTYDYRGIGRSRPLRMRSFEAVVEDWSEWDCGGAIAELRRRFPNAEGVGVGHSVGTMIFGAAANAEYLARFVFVGAHTGFVGDHRRGYRVPMAVLWHGCNAFGDASGRFLPWTDASSR